MEVPHLDADSAARIPVPAHDIHTKRSSLLTGRWLAIERHCLESDLPRYPYRVKP